MELPKPYYDEGGITIYHGDCRDILPLLPKVDLVLTDPPYGIGYKSHLPHNINYELITGDESEFDPSFLLNFPKVILWGANNYCQNLPIGCWIVWDKRLSEAADKMMGSPFELAWSSKRTQFKIIRLLHGGAKNADSPNGDASGQPRLHPTQKPVKLMNLCIGFAMNVDTILDPFMGAGSTLRAAKDLGRHCIGIEIEEKYCAIAVEIFRQEVLNFA